MHPRKLGLGCRKVGPEALYHLDNPLPRANNDGGFYNFAKHSFNVA
jgi:hypothetical protein